MTTDVEQYDNVDVVVGVVDDDDDNVKGYIIPY